MEKSHPDRPRAEATAVRSALVGASTAVLLVSDGFEPFGLGPVASVVFPESKVLHELVPNCQAGFQTSCQHREFVGGAQADLLRVPLADGTLVATPDDALIPSLLSASDVFGTGWWASVAGGVKPGVAVAVVGDGAVALLGVSDFPQTSRKRTTAQPGRAHL